jgi:hypothetical protein
MLCSRETPGREALTSATDGEVADGSVVIRCREGR